MPKMQWNQTETMWLASDKEKLLILEPSTWTAWHGTIHDKTAGKVIDLNFAEDDVPVVQRLMEEYAAIFVGKKWEEEDGTN